MLIEKLTQKHSLNKSNHSNPIETKQAWSCFFVFFITKVHESSYCHASCHCMSRATIVFQMGQGIILLCGHFRYCQALVQSPAPITKS